MLVEEAETVSLDKVHEMDGDVTSTLKALVTVPELKSVGWPPLYEEGDTRLNLESVGMETGEPVLL